MKNKKYMTIGEFSSITGLTIKALRYYDKTNLLKPSYTDENTGYRYYTRNQMQFTNIILMAYALNIPMKNLAKYINADVIEYDSLLTYARTELTRKMNDLRFRLDMVNRFSEMQKRQSLCSFDEYREFEIPDIPVIMVSFDGEINTPEFDLETAKFFDQYKEDELGASCGLLQIKENGVIRKYIFSEATPHTQQKDPKHIRYTIQKSTFKCKLDYNPTNLTDFDSILLLMETFLAYKDKKTIYEILKH
jgi:MerR family transcriptional regulator, activator of bmr gene